MATLDAKLSSALAHVAPADLQRVMCAKKLDAVQDGEIRQTLFLVDHRFRASEIDGDVYGAEHLFSSKMKGEKF